MNPSKMRLKPWPAAVKSSSHVDAPGLLSALEEHLV